jgi:hypothetical protein
MIRTLRELWPFAEWMLAAAAIGAAGGYALAKILVLWGAQ